MDKSVNVGQSSVGGTTKCLRYFGRVAARLIVNLDKPHVEPSQVVSRLEIATYVLYDLDSGAASM